MLTRFLGRMGMLEVIAQYKLGNITFGVPLSRIQWDATDVATYEAPLVDAFCRVVAPLRNVTLFDCGADIGTFSALVCSRTKRITQIVAFEPNSDVSNFLESNLRNLSIPFRILRTAVGQSEGYGRLERPSYDPDDQGRFLVLGDGPIEVTTIDNMNVRGGDVAIKLDIEGGELEALQGAAETIRAADRCVVTVESHPKVARRIGRDPLACLQFLESIRPFRFLTAETGEQPSLSAPTLQRGQTEVHNVVGWTHNE
jgi:FkbM family methyltransferase